LGSDSGDAGDVWLKTPSATFSLARAPEAHGVIDGDVFATEDDGMSLDTRR
jgi:hypothetical protein